MLLEFKVANYLSFKDSNCLSMIASPSSTSTKEQSDAVIVKGKSRILSSAAIYGANASGKSNLFAAIRFMKKLIFNSARESQIGEKIDVKSFRLNSDCDEEPSTFEVTFLVSEAEYKNEKTDIIFRYGFKVDRDKIHAEWLFGSFTAQESKLFTRVEDEISIGEKFAEGKKVYKAIGKIRETTLFLSLIASLKGENALITNHIVSWFKRLQDISGIGDERIYAITANLMSKNSLKEQIIKALYLADICIEDIVVEQKPSNISELSRLAGADTEKKDVKDIPPFLLKSYHKKYNKNKELIGLEEFDFDREESDGSKKFFALIGPVLEALKNGLVLVIDEIDARLHPKLCEVLISLFNSKESNHKNAQLIFATHNTLIMNRKMLRRDQIYFIEKDKYGESELYSLADYKKVRSDASYDKDYLMGKYGAVPCVGDFEAFIAGEV
ncbi:MAG: ATP-binding protein [Desulfamplus sp.]|nr:ATP-binding protein [Desulfamplus sp.]